MNPLPSSEPSQPAGESESPLADPRGACCCPRSKDPKKEQKFEITDRDKLESILIAVPLILVAVCKTYEILHMSLASDAVTVAIISAPIAVFKKQMATKFLNYTKEYQGEIVEMAMRITMWTLAGMFVVLLLLVVNKRFFS